VRAIWLTAFGDPSVLVARDTPEPEPAVGQVLIEVEVASVSFVETQIRAGRPPRAFPLPEPPFILGNGVGGVIAAVGPGVDSGLVGRRVVSTTGGSGGYAERALAGVEELIEVPDAVPTADALALFTDGRTAIGLFRLAKPVAGETVLIEAAAGGVGSLLAQLVTGVGARVIGAVGGARKLAYVRERGLEAVDYSLPGWIDEVRRLAGGPIDVVFDGVGGAIGAAAAGLTDGRFVIHGGASGSMTDPRAVTANVLTLRDVEGTIPELAAAALASGLKPVIGQTFPLERAADAHAGIEARSSIGKTLLVP
jgi:NADPH2:quinone reductase